MLKRRAKKLAPDCRVVRDEDGEIVLFGQPGDRYFEGVQLGRIADRRLLWAARQKGPREGCVIDVGANIGVTAVLLSRALGAPVYAFEPDPRTFADLCRTLSANDLTTVRPVMQGLANTDGELAFYADEDSSASHMVFGVLSGREGTQRVAVTTLDGFLAAESAEEAVRFIKIDAEGAELAVLDGAIDTIGQHRPNLFVEFNLFTLIAFGRIDPLTFLSRLRERFPYVYQFVGMEPYPIITHADAVDFLHRVIMSKGGSTDLFCTFEPV